MTNPNRPSTGRVRARAHQVLGIFAAAATLLCLTLGLTFWIWLGDWRFAATGLLSLLIGLILIGAAQPSRPRRGEPAVPSAVDNAISDVLIEHYGFLPLTTRYGAASLARGHVETWRESFHPQAGADPDPYRFPSGAPDPFTPHPTQFPSGALDPIQRITDDGKADA